jgi:hypothetical protein
MFARLWEAAKTMVPRRKHVDNRRKSWLARLQRRKS